MNRRATAATLVGLVFLLAGCATPPVTTVKQPDGTVQTLHWAEYPGHAYVDAGDVLAAPDAERIDAHGLALLQQIQYEVAADVGIRLTLLESDAELQRFSSNGYGHPSMLTSYACCALSADAVPVMFTDWTRIYDIVNRVSLTFGAGQLVLEQDQEWMKESPDLLADFEATWGTGIDGEYSYLSARTTNSAQSIMLVVDDPARRIGARGPERDNPASITIDYAAIVIEESSRPQFEERLAPFADATRPDSTEWD